MKKIPLIISIVALVVALSGWTKEFLLEKEVVYLDSNKLLSQYEGMTRARAAFEKKSVVWQANIDTLQQELTRQIMTFEKESKGMTPKEQDLSKELIKSKKREFAQYQQAIQQQAQQEDAQMTQHVLDVVNTFIQEYGESQGYELILIADQGNIAYAVDGLNITDEVVTELNNAYHGK